MIPRRRCPAHAAGHAATGRDSQLSQSPQCQDVLWQIAVTLQGLAQSIIMCCSCSQKRMLLCGINEAAMARPLLHSWPCCPGTWRAKRHSVVLCAPRHMYLPWDYNPAKLDEAGNSVIWGSTNLLCLGVLLLQRGLPLST